jgi:hypothetical protein
MRTPSRSTSTRLGSISTGTGTVTPPTETPRLTYSLEPLLSAVDALQVAEACALIWSAVIESSAPSPIETSLVIDSDSALSAPRSAAMSASSAPVSSTEPSEPSTSPAESALLPKL